MGNIYGYTPSGNVHETDGKLNKGRIISRILSYTAKERFFVISSFVLSLIFVVCTLIVPIKIGDAIDYIVLGSFTDKGFSVSLLEAAFCILAAGISQYTMNRFNNHIVYHTVESIRRDAFTKINEFPISLLDTKSKGDMISRLTTDADQFADGLLMGFSQLFTGVITILGTLLFMLSMNIAITCIVVLVTPLSLFVARFIASHTYDMFKLQSKERGAQTALIDEVLSNEKMIKAYKREVDMLEKFDVINKRLESASLKATFYSSLTNPSTRVVTNIVYALVAGVGALAVISGGSMLFGTITVGTLTCFLSYANQYMKPFNEISSVLTELQNALVCADRVFEIIDSKEKETENDDPALLENVQGNVSCSGIDFAYDSSKPILKGINIDVHAGDRVAIVGPTGCGKTTLINLLMRFYDTNNGTISIDGIDIKEALLESVRTSYGMVLQDTWLFSGTIKDNIRYAKNDATDEEVINAAKEAYAHSFIRRLPNGYDTYIGEDGGMLSQGQKQLLCIARLMLIKPPMLILDEATSSIDTRTEKMIQSAFLRLMEGRTSFIVAHRLSTIRDADHILVMKDGEIIEQGKHDDLILKNGFYAKLYNMM